MDTYERLVKVNPAHKDGWLQLGRIRQYGIGSRYKDHLKAEAAYRRQLEANPAHFGARLQLGILLKELGKTDEAIRYLNTVVDTTNSYQREAVLTLAEVYPKRREYEQSETLFNAYIDELGAEDADIYYDLSLVAQLKELALFKAAPKEQWKSISELFWAGRDPAPVTAANERRIEHYRRVAYSRAKFGEFLFPWDARGEVYVRYGEPDHISRSEDILFEVAPKVVKVKERLLNEAGNAIGPLVQSREAWASGEAISSAIGPASSTLKEIGQTGSYRIPGGDGVAKSQGAGGASGTGAYERSTALMRSSTILGWPIYPVMDKVWEYWIYTDVGKGIEVTFTQSLSPGPYEYVEQPLSIGEIGLARGRPITQTWQQMNPRVVINRVASKTPEVYRPDFATGPLDFFFGSARFKGDESNTDLEVYYGIPTDGLTYAEGEDGKQVAHLKRGVALFDEDNRQVHRASNDILLSAEGNVDSMQTRFVPVMDRIGIVPGTYRMSVQILDMGSEKSQVYNQKVVIYPFESADLKISDIELAASIRPDAGGEFSKRGLQVIPNPSLAYLPGQSIFIYYEVYNLKKDEFGATNYRVSYEVKSLEKKQVQANILSALGRLLRTQKDAEAITVEYEHIGDRVDDIGYLELSMANTEPGEQVLKVRITEGNSGKTAIATTTFTIK